MNVPRYEHPLDFKLRPWQQALMDAVNKQPKKLILLTPPHGGDFYRRWMQQGNETIASNIAWMNYAEPPKGKRRRNEGRRIRKERRARPRHMIIFDEADGMDWSKMPAPPAGWHLKL